MTRIKQEIAQFQKEIKLGLFSKLTDFMFIGPCIIVIVEE